MASSFRSNSDNEHVRRWGSRRILDHHSDDAVFSSHFDTHDDEESALTWAALERLPTFDRVRKGMLRNVGADGASFREMVEVSKLGLAEKQQFVDKILKDVEEDNELFLLKLRKRMDK